MQCALDSKAKVEQSVLIVERWILARLRDRRFLNLADLNAAIGALVADINGRRMKGYEASRAELFAEVDRPALKPLPNEPYAFAVWKRCRRGLSEARWYSAPFRLIKELVDVRVADKTVEIFLKGQRVASHARAPTAAATPPSPSTCRARTAGTPPGRRRASSPTPRRSAPRPPPCARRS